MRVQIILPVCCALSIAVCAAEYRLFTNQNGQTIKAKVVSVDLEAETVTLEKTNRKKATVPINIFSEADQEFIRSSNEQPTAPAASSTPAPVKLSKDAVRSIAEKYANGWNQRDIDSIVNLFDNPKKVARGEYKFRAGGLDKVRVGSVYESYFSIKFATLANTDLDIDGKTSVEWCLLTADGKIKYDSMLRLHPVMEARLAILRTTAPKGLYGDPQYEDETYQKYYVKTMKSTGIPSFGFTVGSDKRSMENSIEQTIEWLLENGTTYDNSEPKLYLPEKVFKEEKDLLKQAKRRI